MEHIVYEKISENRERILSLWQAAALPQGRGLPLSGSAKSRMVTPADCLLQDEVEALFDWLISEDEPVEARLSVQEICKLKAVQSVNPSEALGFILDLKGIVRLVIGAETPVKAYSEEFKSFDKRIDQLLLLAFDEYSDCRDQIMEIRIEEVRRLAGRSA